MHLLLDYSRRPEFIPQSEQTHSQCVCCQISVMHVDEVHTEQYKHGDMIDSFKVVYVMSLIVFLKWCHISTLSLRAANHRYAENFRLFMIKFSV